MEAIFSNLDKCLLDATQRCRSNCIALSGGLDSSILAYYMNKKKPKAIVVVTTDYPASDLLYAQLVAKRFQLSLIIKKINIEDLLFAIEETIRILKNFNHIEIRNSIVTYIVLKTAKENGCTDIATGDGCDELFAGYYFFQKKNDLQKDLERIWKIMHFPSLEIGRSLGINVETPFLYDEVLKYAKSLSADLKVHEENGIKYGKWILRKAFENKLPDEIVWREKTPMQDGSGTKNLTILFENMISDADFNLKKEKYLKERVNLKTKESFYYYELYRKYFEPPYKLDSSKHRCPECSSVIGDGSHFCQMCGSFPI